ncbi:hypothetical protein BN14_09930 [Rhizoctonia solani AG-1 IB]|uniref:Uncharacterized protein n=1 Tax=Thanatephorus cucumeris (strain AG1-IB / isolate 7/3/14) TaxID=1108050 RepID=M5C9R4_THACB|nr:hypothetical protein BN14_09930 [Rhizoctonia solani AG-1 IB]
MDGFDEGLKDTKKRRGEAKKQHKPRDEQDRPPMVQLRRGSSLSSRQAAVAGLGRSSMSSSDVERMVEEQGEESQGEKGRQRGDGGTTKTNGDVVKANGGASREVAA